MKRYYFVLLVIFLLKVNSYSQSINPWVIASGGVYNEAGNVKVYSTIGEPVIQTFYTNDNIITQGFQQPHFNITIISDNDNSIVFNIFPNPVLQNVLNISSNNENNFIITLSDIAGKTLLQKSFQKFISIDFESFAAGNYFISIYSTDNTLLKNYKIVKL